MKKLQEFCLPARLTLPQAQQPHPSKQMSDTLTDYSMRKKADHWIYHR